MPAQSEWYRTLFSGLFVEAQRRIPWPTAAGVEFLLKHLEPASGAKILDVPCGHGRLSLPLAEKGFGITGVDLCGELLDDARKSAAAKGLSAKFEQRDMRDLPWPGRFDSAFCWGNSFTYLGDEGDRAFLAAVFGALKPCGRFVLETYMVSELIFINRLQRSFVPLDDLLFLVDTTYDAAASTLISSYTVIHNGRTERAQATYRIYSCREILRMVADAGFVDVRTFGSLEGEPFALGAKGLYLVASKPA